MKRKEYIHEFIKSYENGIKYGKDLSDKEWIEMLTKCLSKEDLKTILEYMRLMRKNRYNEGE